MSDFPWFPLGFGIPGCAIGPLRKEDDGYQIIATRGGDKVALVVESESLVGNALQKAMASVICGVSSFEFAGRSYLSRVFEKEEQPVVLRDWPKIKGFPTSSEIAGLSEAIRRLRDGYPKADVGRALYLPTFLECLPVAEVQKQNLRSLAIDVLVAGAPISTINLVSIRSVNPWLLPEEIENFLGALGIADIAAVGREGGGIDVASFTLPGRPKLETFFREYVLEPSADRKRYASFGVTMPNGILLYGPPGSGKSHTVKKLGAALGWPIFEFDLGAMGSPFIHQTSRELRNVFDEAKRNAPSLIILEEVDALAGSRGPMMNEHKVEEVAELLRLVETASENNILVIATTNRRDSLDPAILRRGRFDHMFEVAYPDREEVRTAIDAMLNDRPHRDIPNLEQLATKLANRPMSDIAWVINEAARLATRGKKDAIDEIDLFSAFERLQKK